MYTPGFDASWQRNLFCERYSSVSLTKTIWQNNVLSVVVVLLLQCSQYCKYLSLLRLPQVLRSNWFIGCKQVYTVIPVVFWKAITTFSGLLVLIMRVCQELYNSWQLAVRKDLITPKIIASLLFETRQSILRGDMRSRDPKEQRDAGYCECWTRFV